MTTTQGADTMDVTINYEDLQFLIRLAGHGIDHMIGCDGYTAADEARLNAIDAAASAPAGLPPKAQARLRGIDPAEQEATDARWKADRERLTVQRERLVARLERDSRVVAADRTVPPIMMPVEGAEATIAEVMTRRDRSEVTKTIRTFLKARTGRMWSVTGGTGTAWGWLRITAPGGRKVDYRATMEDQIMLGLALGLERPEESFSVASSDGHWLAALQRAAGLEVTGSEAQYWD